LCAKELQLKPKKLRTDVFLSKYNFNDMPWHMTTGNGNVEVLEKLWEWNKNCS
jgi:hypothetical protein